MSSDRALQSALVSQCNLWSYIMVCQPQYLLFCDSDLTHPLSSDGNCEPLIGQGQWHFVLERLDEKERLEAMDYEPRIHRDRCALLAVVRGLEALEQPGHVRLMTTSRYVDRGMRFGLPNWREANYLWESFGTFKPIRNADLWQRINSAMQFHEISCRLLGAHKELAESLICRRKGRLAIGVGLEGSTLAGEHDLDGTQPMPSNKRPLLTGSRPRAHVQRPRRQWWDMAAAWVDNVKSPSVRAGGLSTVPN